jgi:EAL domain-containing protein (putative c-di-GMP-specific phosphodiesterase class I)
MGCDFGQGFLFAKAMTVQELMSAVMAGRAKSKPVGGATSA